MVLCAVAVRFSAVVQPELEDRLTDVPVFW